MTGPLALRAAEVARVAHQGQTDKAGAPYISHPERVAARVREAALVRGAANATTAGPAQLDPAQLDPAQLDPAQLDPAEAVAWLHDVAEDTAVTLGDLAGQFPELVVAAVDALTRRPGEDPDHYYGRIRANPLALAVKAADLADNSDPRRLDLLDAHTRERLESKYAHAREALGLTEPAS